MNKLIILLFISLLVVMPHLYAEDVKVCRSQIPLEYADNVLKYIKQYSSIKPITECTIKDRILYEKYNRKNKENILKEVQDFTLKDLEPKKLNNSISPIILKDKSNKKDKDKSRVTIGVSKELRKIKYLNTNLDLFDDIAIYDNDAKEHYLDEFENKSLLLVFWATWSSSCLNELIALDDLKKDFKKLPFEIIPISEDYQDTKVVQDYFKQYNIRHITSYYDKRNKLFKALKVVGLPTAFIVNVEGEIMASLQGNVNWYDNDIREFLLLHIKIGSYIPKNSYRDRSLNYQFRKVDNKSKSTNSKELEQKK